MPGVSGSSVSKRVRTNVGSILFGGSRLGFCAVVLRIDYDYTLTCSFWVWYVMMTKNLSDLLRSTACKMLLT